MRGHFIWGSAFRGRHQRLHAIIRQSNKKPSCFAEVGADGPTFVLRKEEVVELSEAWFQQIIGQEVEGVELVLLEEAGTRRQKILRLYVDHPDGVTHELCARVSTAVEKVLDERDVIEGTYMLEVSSPGLERPLRKRSHFEAQLGKMVYVKTKVPVEGSKVWQGTLLEVGEDAIVIEEHGRVARIPLGDVGSAHLIYEFR
jgi:ribosome maturation factor RimP